MTRTGCHWMTTEHLFYKQQNPRDKAGEGQKNTTRKEEVSMAQETGQPDPRQFPAYLERRLWWHEHEGCNLWQPQGRLSWQRLSLEAGRVWKRNLFSFPHRDFFSPPALSVRFHCSRNKCCCQSAPYVCTISLLSLCTVFCHTICWVHF